MTCICQDGYAGPTFRCWVGHEFRFDWHRLPVPAIDAVVDAGCPLVEDGEVCGQALDEIECWHTPLVIEEMRGDAQEGSRV